MMMKSIKYNVIIIIPVYMSIFSSNIRRLCDTNSTISSVNHMPIVVVVRTLLVMMPAVALDHDSDELTNYRNRMQS